MSEGGERVNQGEGGGRIGARGERVEGERNRSKPSCTS